MSAVLDRRTRPGRTILRIAAVRWLIAGLIPFGCLAVGLLIARTWSPVIFLGFLLASFGNYTACAFYFYKVLGTAVGWVLALFPPIIANVAAGAVTVVGSATIQSPQHPDGVKIIATTSWWIAAACLAVTLAVTVALAVANGERWMRHNQYNLPRNKFEAYTRSRGTLARLWLPRLQTSKGQHLCRTPSVLSWPSGSCLAAGQLRDVPRSGRLLECRIAPGGARTERKVTGSPASYEWCRR